MRSFSLEGRKNDFLVLAEQLQYVCRFIATQNRTINSRLSERELALPGSDYPSFASNAWGGKTDIMRLQIMDGV